MNLTRKIPLLSSLFPKNPEKRDFSVQTNQNKSEISTITANFAKITQNSLIFAAQTSLYPAQKISIITASNDRSLNGQKGGRDDA